MTDESLWSKVLVEENKLRFWLDITLGPQTHQAARRVAPPKSNIEEMGGEDVYSPDKAVCHQQREVALW